MSMLSIIKDLLIPKSVFLTCQIKGHDVNEDDRTKKYESIIKCKRCKVPLFIRNDKIHEFYSPED